MTVGKQFKKMAGTSAVFILDTHQKSSPVERDGLSWTAEELHLNQLTSTRFKKPAIANVLALEGLEEYDPPANGDVRWVDSIGADFVYHFRVKAWIQLTGAQIPVPESI